MNSQNNTPLTGLSMLQIEIELSHRRVQQQGTSTSTGVIFDAPLGGERKCCKCKQTLSRADFSKDRSKKSGLQSKCRQCSNLCVESWRLKQNLSGEKKFQSNRAHKKAKKDKTRPPVRRARAQKDSRERALRDDRLTVRNRRHIPTQHIYGPLSKQRMSDDLEKRADKILKDNPERK